MKKQTAVEWLEEFMNNDKQKSEGIISLAFAKAKEMEKEQIIEACDEGYVSGKVKAWRSGWQYYNETYKNTNK